MKFVNMIEQIMYKKFFQMTIYRRIMRKNVKYENMLNK